MTRLLLLVIVVTTFGGCARPGDHPISPNCEWIESDHRTLNLATLADRRHLRFDAATAEDVAIRWPISVLHIDRSGTSDVRNAEKRCSQASRRLMALTSLPFVFTAATETSWSMRQ